MAALFYIRVPAFGAAKGCFAMRRAWKTGDSTTRSWQAQRQYSLTPARISAAMLRRHDSLENLYISAMWLIYPA
jgi:hypothetical protein